MLLTLKYPTVWGSLKAPGERAQKREIKAQELLIGLIDLYIQGGRPIGSQALQNEGFSHLSSATIRNYFALLDKKGLLEQVHTSGGRIPTDRAWQYYFEKCTSPLTVSLLQDLEKAFSRASLHDALYERLSAINDALARWSHCASFLSMPIFEQDSISYLKIWPFHFNRWAILLRSRIGFFNYELFSFDSPLENVRPNVIEAYLQNKIQNHSFIFSNLTEQEYRLSHEIYHELMLRQLTYHARPQKRVWLHSGLSNLLHYPEFKDAEHLAHTLRFFEQQRSKDKLLKIISGFSTTQAWIGAQLQQLFIQSKACALVACPFFIHQQMAGLIGIVGPKRLPYAQVRHALEYSACLITHHLTHEYHMFKLACKNDLKKEKMQDERRRE